MVLMVRFFYTLLASLFMVNGAVAGPVVEQSSDSVPAEHVGESLISYLGEFVGQQKQPLEKQAVELLIDELLSSTEKHPEYASVHAKLEYSEQAEKAAFAAYLPKIYGNSSSGYRRENGDVTKDTTLGVGLNQLLYDFGATSSRVDAAKFGAKVSSAELDGKRNELLYRGVKAWHELYRAQRMVKLHRLNVASRKEIVDFVAQRAEMGGSAQSDVLRARARWADAEAGVARAEGQVERAKAIWLEVVGMPSPERVEIKDIVEIDQVTGEGLSQIAQRFTAVQRAYAKHDVASSEATATEAEKLPKLMLDLSISKLLDAPSNYQDDRSAQIKIQYDFYTGGAKAARASQAKAQAAQAFSDAESELRQAEKTLRQAQADVEAGGRTVAARREAASVAADSMKAVREQFAYRRGTLLDLLRVQEDLFFAGRNLIDAVTDNALSRYQFLYLSSRLEDSLQQ